MDSLSNSGPGRPLKVVMLSTYPKGGAGWACFRLAEALRGEGHEVRLLTAHKGPAGTDWQVVAQPKVNRWQAYAMRLGLRKNHYQFRNKFLASLSPEYDWFSFPESEYEVEKHPDLQWADVIHLHWVADFIDMPRFFKRWAGRKPIFWTLHDMNPLTGGCHYIGTCAGFKIGCPVCPQVPPGYKKTLAAEGFSLKQEVLENVMGSHLQLIALSSWMEVMMKSPLLNRFKRHRAVNPVDVSIFKPAPSPLRNQLCIPSEMRLLLFVADYTSNKRKGADLLMEALKILDIPAGMSVGLLTVGEGQMPSIPIGMSHFPLGKLSSPEDMAQAYQAADFFILPSRQDNLPNTAVEALACGTPVVGFNVGGVADLIDAPEKGVLVEGVSATALARGIEKALQTEYVREANVEKYAYASVARHYAELYQKSFA